MAIRHCGKFARKAESKLCPHCNEEIADVEELLPAYECVDCGEVFGAEDGE